jgi:hypothetical protein
MVVARKKAHQLEPVFRQPRRVIAQCGDRFQPIDRQLGRCSGFDHHAEPRARAEWNGDAIACGERHPLRRGVIEEPRERYIQGDADDGICA